MKILLLTTLWICGLMGKVNAVTYVVYSDNGAYATASTPSAALNSCRKSKGKKCRFLTYRNGKTIAIKSGMYYTIYRSISNKFGIAYDSDKTKSQKMALEFCNMQSANCKFMGTFISY
jgi:hypothetical protein